MANKIVISDGKKNEKKQSNLNPQIIKDTQSIPAGTEKKIASETVPTPLDENVWGNDNTILDKLDEKILADRRLFVRIRYMHRIECSAMSDSSEAEPCFLDPPHVFLTIDLSMGGIGIICDDEIGIGKVLAIRLILDTIPYDIKCEVMYCFPNDGKFRVGLRIIQREKRFIRHLKIFIARTSLNSAYGDE